MPKRKKRTKKKSGRFLLASMALVLLVLFSFVVGVLLSAKQGIAQQGALRTQHMTSSKMDVQPLLPIASIHVPILVYHYVEFVRDPKDTVRMSLNIMPSIFEMQIKTLKEAGYNFVTAAELGQYLDGKKQLPQKPVILTFDDGYGDFYTDVFPLLKKYDIVATEYIISDLLDRPNYMTTEQVGEIAESGLVEIGAHTVHHHNLKTLPLGEVKKEIEGSKEELEKKFGISVVSFAYPYGGYTEEIVQLVKKAGFTNAVTTKGGRFINQENRYSLFRIHPGIAVGEALLKEL